MDDLSTQYRILSTQLLPAETVLTASETVFLLAKSWLQRWELYTQGQGAHPGPIDNNSLYSLYRKDEGVRTAILRKDMKDDVDYKYVSKFIWKQLQSLYPGGPETELFVFSGEVDWSPALLHVETNTNSQYFRISLSLPMHKFKKYVCEKLQLPPDKYEVRLGDVSFERDLAVPLQKLGVRDRDVLVLKDKMTIDLQEIEEEGDNAVEAFHDIPLPRNLGGTFLSEELADESHSNVIESTNFVMNIGRDDKAEVAARIATSLKCVKARLQISSISKTRSRLESLYEDWQRDDVSR